MISIHNLSFEYKKNKPLFNHINLNLPQGGICGLLGKNGSGKSTLLKMISGLIFPNSGRCKVMDYNPAFRQPRFLEKIYYLPEEIFVPDLTIKQYLNFYASFYNQFDLDLMHNWLEEFSLSGNDNLTKLSYGQKKKFLITFALATNSKLLILDEPTNGLDIPSKAKFRKLVASTYTEEKLFIISTHQVHDVENLIDKVIILDEGKILIKTNIFEISNNLTFDHQPSTPDPNKCLYYEKDLGGYKVLSKKEDDNDTHVDLEILFNAALVNKLKLQTILGGEL